MRGFADPCKKCCSDFLAPHLSELTNRIDHGVQRAIQTALCCRVEMDFDLASRVAQCSRYPCLAFLLLGSPVRPSMNPPLWQSGLSKALG